MAKRRSLEDTLRDLNGLREELRADPASARVAAELGRALGAKDSLVVARAAQIAGEFEVRAVAGDLEAAYDRFMIDPEKSDRQCTAKTQIATALYAIGHGAESLFLRGLHHVQREPVWGGSVDTAAGLRAACALGLVRIRYPDIMPELAILLADPEPPARLGAVQALVYSEDACAVPLLRYKALIGDDDLGVIAECLNGLLRFAPEGSVSFVARFLENHDVPTQEIAALALGGSRRREAFDILKPWWERARDAELRETGLLAIGMLGQEEAFAFLLSLVAEAPARFALGALAALEVYLEGAAMRRRVRAAIAGRSDLKLPPAIAQKLAADDGDGMGTTSPR